MNIRNLPRAPYFHPAEDGSAIIGMNGETVNIEWYKKCLKSLNNWIKNSTPEYIKEVNREIENDWEKYQNEINKSNSNWQKEKIKGWIYIYKQAIS